MLMKKSGENFHLVLHEDEMASLAADLAKYGMTRRLREPSMEFIKVANHLYWIDNGLNIHDDVEPYSEFIEWGDEDASEEG